MEVQEELWWVIRCSDSLTKQKAKVRWLVEDDKNSKYFYSSLKWHRRNGTLKGLSMGGVWVAEPGRVDYGRRRKGELNFSWKEESGSTQKKNKGKIPA